MPTPLVLGAVAYDPKVVTIWDGFREWFRSQGVRLDFVLYPHYERQVDDLLAGRIDLAWHSPLAWVRTRRLAASRGLTARTLVMRDTDQALTSAVLVRTNDDIRSVPELSGGVVATGAIDSPQSHLIPIALLDAHGLAPGDYDLRRFDRSVGTHGDDLAGEREAVEALLAGEAAATCVLTASQLTFAAEGLIRPGTVRTLVETEPFDHCVMAAIDGMADDGALVDVVELLLAMDYDDPTVRHLLDLEGLRAWRPGRADRFGQLERAVDLVGLYDAKGRLGGTSYDP